MNSPYEKASFVVEYVNSLSVRDNEPSHDHLQFLRQGTLAFHHTFDINLTELVVTITQKPEEYQKAWRYD